MTAITIRRTAKTPSPAPRPALNPIVCVVLVWLGWDVAEAEAPGPVAEGEDVEVAVVENAEISAAKDAVAAFRLGE